MGIPASCCILKKQPKTKTSENNKKKPQKIMDKVKHSLFLKHNI